MIEITVLLLLLILSFKLRRLNKEVKGLKLNIQKLSAKLDLGNELSSEIASPNKTVSTSLAEKKAKFAQAFSSKSFSKELIADHHKDKISSVKEKETETIALSSFEVPVPLKNDVSEEKNKKSISLEMQLGTRLPVWIGGVALMLAGFFFVKYSIDLGLLNPQVRVVLGLIFGCTLLMAGNWMKNHPNIANSTRISQALSGAGISDLFICLFAAHSLYGILPASFTFLGMAIVTFLAVVLSLKQGMPVALMGLIGGYLTPLMVGSEDPQGIILFTYLYFVFAGLMIVIRKNNWWSLAIPSVIGLFIWVCVWLFGNNYSTDDSKWLILFLIAITSTTLVASKDHLTEKTEVINRANLFFNYLTIIGVLILSSMITSLSGFGFIDWGLFGLLSLSSIVLAYFNQKLYGLAPWISMCVTALMLFSWKTKDANAFALTITSFGSLFTISSVLVHFRSGKPQLWIGLASITSIVYYFLGYYELRHSVLVANIPLFWGALALTFSMIAGFALRMVHKIIPENFANKQVLMAIYAATSSSFLSIALTIELEREFLSVAFAAQTFALAIIYKKTTIKALRYLSGILAGLCISILIPQILDVGLAIASKKETYSFWQHGWAIIKWPIFQLGVPALLFILTSFLLRQKEDQKLHKCLEATSIFLLSIMGYCLIHHPLQLQDSVLFAKETFFESSLVTNFFFLFGVICLWIGRTNKRPAVSLSGLFLSGLAVLRLCYYDIFAENPLWTHVAVGPSPLFNGLILIYGLPILWIWKILDELQYFKHRNVEAVRKSGYGLMLLLAFGWVSLNVRQIFHGTFLDNLEFSTAEIYSYSVAWLIFGVILLILGTYCRNKLLRMASLAFMILTIGKVFFFDARELEGLLRVASFLGLGFSLLCLSWFYTKFNFPDNIPKSV